MTVSIRPFAQGGPGDFTGRFTDSFDRADTTDSIGSSWAANRTPSIVNVNVFRISTNELIWTHTAGSGTHLYAAFALPSGPLGGRGQFSQAVLRTDNSVPGTLTRVGPAVLMQGNVTSNFGCYCIENLPELSSFNVQRVVAGVATNIADHSATPLYSAFPITLKLTAVVNSGSVSVKSFLNGVQIDDLTDTNASRPTAGVPGMYGQFSSATAQAIFSEFRSGPGSG